MNGGRTRLEETTRDTAESLPGALDRLEREGASAPPAHAADVLAAAEQALLRGPVPPPLWHRYLDLTRRRTFLLALGDATRRNRWAATAFGAIRASGYSLADLLAQRVAAHPDRVFLQASPAPDAARWTYAQVARRLRSLAAAFGASCDGPPRVAIVAENGLDAACCDLACLVHGIFVAPVAPYLSSAEIGSLLDRLAVNVAVVDTAGQLDKLEAVLKERPGSVRPFLVDAAASLRRPGTLVLGEEVSRLDAGGIDRALASLAPFGLDETATVLFTSGSTGAQKGVAFSPFHLLSKRFARAAALPFVGEEEVLLCYLPLYHTFGRFLELLGTLFWGGTYVFAGNPSLDTFLAGLQKVRPTGLVGIPARWAQLHERCQRRIGPVAGPEQEAEAVRAVTGGRLSWGLSAAGYLEPSVFRFFQRSGVSLCSGFGMTEATGGITMSRPGAYEDGTVGIALPGIDVRLDRESGGSGPDEGELLISGPYVARDLDESGPLDGDARWFRTGDVFRRRPSGSLEIIDRIKDIFKNSRGQTVAPRRVEQLFEGVPGFRRTFLAGDGRDDSVLLVVPDTDAPLLADLDEDERQSYFKRIVAEANLELAPHERVVGFAVLDRDFSSGSGELTPKGSYRRKVIEENFRDVLHALYRGSAVTLSGPGVRVRVPRWLHRDVGILEGDLALGEDALEDGRRGLSLTLRRVEDTGAVRIGDLEYAVAGDTVDLGLLAHQPLLWLGNPALAAFFPLKGGWDTPPGAFSLRVRLPAFGRPVPGAASSLIPSPALAELHRTIASALFGGREEALEAVRVLEDRLGSADPNTAIALRRRFEALSRHPDLDVRCAAYRILLLDEPAPGTASNMESFLESGLPFLSAESVETIARSGVPGERLTALRRRLQGYRVGLPRPFPQAQAKLLADVFTLLARHARRHREDHVAVRSELACWSLEETEPRLAGEAETLLNELSGAHEKSLPHRACFRSRLAFREGLPASEREGLERLFDTTGFFEESLELACGESVTPEDLGPGGIWIAPVATVRRHRLYRVGINTLAGRHTDFLLIVGDDLAPDAVRRTKLWMEALASPAEGTPVVPAFGCYREELRALSVGWVDEPTLAMRLWELEQPAAAGAAASLWRTLFVRALAAFFSAWEASGRRLVPGSISPANVVVPRYDFREGAVLLSLAGHRAYEGPRSLVGPMVRNFFVETLALYPHARHTLQRSWIADACVEALGLDAARVFLDELVPALRSAPPGAAEASFADDLDAERRRLGASFHPPLALLSAIARFEAWEALEPQAPLAAREAMARGLERVYRLERFPEIVRYHLHRKTTFSGSSGPALRAFDVLLDAMFRRPGHWPVEMVELADVQASLERADERLAFGKLVFPGAAQDGDVTLAAVGDGRRHLVTTTRVTDRTGADYSVRDPLDPGELGRLVQLLVRSGVPRKYFEGRRHLVVLDGQERVVGGVSYSLFRGSSAQLDGIAVTPALRGRGLSSALLDDLCSRLRGLGIDTFTRHLAFRDVPLGHAFRYDPRWRCLVRRCTPDRSPPDSPESAPSAPATAFARR